MLPGQGGKARRQAAPSCPAILSWSTTPPRRLPLPARAGQSRAFHAKGQRRAVQAQAHRYLLGARAHPFGLLQRRQDQRPLTRCPSASGRSGRVGSWFATGKRLEKAPFDLFYLVSSTHIAQRLLEPRDDAFVLRLFGDGDVSRIVRLNLERRLRDDAAAPRL